MREEVDVQRRKVESREQETFTAQYQLVGLQEEIEKIGQQRKITEEERDALKKSLKEEEVARIAAEGRIALPTSREGDEFSSPKKRNLAKRDSLKENIDPKVPDEYASMVEMQDQLALEKRMRQKAEDQIHFLKMECQFRCCSCRIAEREGTEYHYDGSPAHEPEPKASNMNITYSNPGFDHMADPFFDPVSTPSRGLTPLEDSEPLIKFSPTSGTFYKTPSPPKTTNPKPYSPSHSPEHILTAPPTSSAPPPNPQLSTPFHRPFPPLRSATAGQTHTVKTTTVTIPLATTPVPISVPFSPGSTMTREEALEQIRMRRGRARSIAAGNGTPRRAMVQGLERRDISAPAGRV